MKLRKCKYCLLEVDISDKKLGWMANHVRWCNSNPNLEKYKEKLKTSRDVMNSSKKKTGYYNQFSKAALTGNSVPTSKIKGTTKNKDKIYYHTDKTKELLRDKALNSDHRRLRKKMIEYNGIMLDSSWELALATRLDQLKIKWIRPDPIKWTDASGVRHNYFSDFFLVDYNIYLDPKNPHAIKVQSDKLSILKTILPNLIILGSLEEINNFTI